MRYLFLILLFPSIALAIPMNIAIASNAQVTRDAGYSLARSAIRNLSKELAISAEPKLSAQSISSQITGILYAEFEAEFRRLEKLIPGFGITLLILPPLNAGGLEYFGGLAHVCPSRNEKKLATVWAKVGSETKTKSAIKHEIGHILGAEHDDAILSDTEPASVMHHNAIAYAGERVLRFSRRSKREIKDCLFFGF